ncbi:prepilin-type N-terminal cleavage/methylation domain-containing protein [bacterium]|jgi:prepilin-type N-terminal cleavage/methylation domain-containing protein|nr:prepilin-type N-terminal cleavage/methylation domain-containing protein [bacterium]
MYSDVRKAFTLVEILIGVSIFAVLSLGIYQVTRTFGKGATESLKATSSQQDIAQAFLLMRKELFWSTNLLFPPLKVHSPRLEVRSRDEKVKYLFEEGKLSRSVGDKKRTLVQGLKEFHFYRLDSKLLEIQLHTSKDFLSTRIFLENLGKMP